MVAKMVHAMINKLYYLELVPYELPALLTHRCMNIEIELRTYKTKSPVETKNVELPG